MRASHAVKKPTISIQRACNFRMEQSLTRDPDVGRGHVVFGTAPGREINQELIICLFFRMSSRQSLHKGYRANLGSNSQIRAEVVRVRFEVSCSSLLYLINGYHSCFIGWRQGEDWSMASPLNSNPYMSQPKSACVFSWHSSPRVNVNIPSASKTPLVSQAACGSSGHFGGCHFHGPRVSA